MAKKKTTSARPAAKAAQSKRRPEQKKAAPQTERAKAARPAAQPKAAQPAPTRLERPKAAQPQPERPKAAQPPAPPPRRTLAVPTVTAAPPPGQRPGRNEPCYCGSGRKYKHCHLAEDDARAAAARAEAAATQSETPAEPVSAAPLRPPKHETHQPWKGATSRGFVPRARTPRKVGGS